MTFIRDLAPCTYLGRMLGPLTTARLRAVGWLDRGHPYTEGRVGTRWRHKLAALVQACREHQPGHFLGFHACTLCGDYDAMGRFNLLLPTDDVIYVAPELVTHYVGSHGYRPPEEFVVAVRDFPDVDTEDFDARYEALVRTWLR